MIKLIKKLWGIQNEETPVEKLGKYEIKTARSGEKYFILKATNGKTILKSEMYKTTQGALVGIASVTKNAVTTEIEIL